MVCVPLAAAAMIGFMAYLTYRTVTDIRSTGIVIDEWAGDERFPSPSADHPPLTIPIATVPWLQFAWHPRDVFLPTARFDLPPYPRADHPIPVYVPRAIVPVMAVARVPEKASPMYVERAKLAWRRTAAEPVALMTQTATMPWKREAAERLRSPDGGVPSVYVPLAWVKGNVPAGEEQARAATEAAAKAWRIAADVTARRDQEREAAARREIERRNEQQAKTAKDRQSHDALQRDLSHRLMRERILQAASRSVRQQEVDRLIQQERAGAQPAGEPPPWPGFVMSMARGADGSVWIGSEDQGVYQYIPSTQTLRQFTTKDGLGDDNGYAVAVDHQGRVWAGHLNHGVSVYNGQQWQCYEVVGGLSQPDTLSGPLGERVFDIAVCPTDGDVWIATSAGLSRYSPSHDDWSYYTRGMNLVHGEVIVGSGQLAVGRGNKDEGGRMKDEGERVGGGRSADFPRPRTTDNGQLTTDSSFIPSDQVQAIAFDAEGNIYCATQCDGMAMANARDGYRHWRTVRGPERMPTEPAGDGLPTSLMNDVLVASDGTVYAATTTGLAWSADKGKTWRYVRGTDYADKVRGLYGGPPEGWTEKKPSDISLPTADRPLPTLLPEDYVTCLAEGSDGLLWIGYRQKGYEAMDPATGRPYPVLGAGERFVTALLANGAGELPAVGTYGEGQDVPDAAKRGVASAVVQAGPPKFPAGATPLTEAKLVEMAERVKALPSGSLGPNAAYLGEDWMTQGDWVGRYGRQHNVLCAAMSPFDHQLIWDNLHRIGRKMGPHHRPGDTLRGWIHWIKTDTHRSLYDPIAGVRRQAEWDDHGETYPLTQEGPDIWVSLKVPAGVQRVSLYFMNKDGHQGNNRLRDYRISLYDGPIAINMDWWKPPLAEARVRDFRGGVYEQFVVSGPGEYSIQIVRNGSFNTILSAVLVDRIHGAKTQFDDIPIAWLGGVRYDPPELTELPSAGMGYAALRAWLAMDDATASPAAAAIQTPLRRSAFRAELAAEAPRSLLANWRWALRLWTGRDRDEFNDAMDRGWERQVKISPNMVWEKRTPLQR